MSTNFYAHYAIADNVTAVWHIGKASNGSLISLFCGQVFASVKAWTRFLLFNKDKVVVQDEYGTVVPTDQFISDHVEGERPSRAQLMKEYSNGYPSRELTFLYSFEKPPEGTYWLDENYNAVFLNAEFC